MASSPGGSTSVSQRLVSFLIDADDVLQCEICMEAFDSEKKPPKLLPCGHNFCEACLFSLCLHQEFNFLDSISCPTCRNQFETSAALNAPTNYDLCKMLESVKRGQDLNVTVIHVADKSFASSASKAQYAVDSSTPQRKLRGKMKKNGIAGKKTMISLDPVYEKPENVECKKLNDPYRCTDCKRKISSSNRCKMSRFCQRCFGNDKVLHLSCLECCVNKHNGHQLKSIDDLEFEHQKLLNELRELGPRRSDISVRFDEGLKLLEEESNINLDFCSLGRAKQTLIKESDKCYSKSISMLEDPFFTPLPPAVISKIRHRQLHNFTRLQKMFSLLEKCHQNVQTRLDRHLNMLTKSLPKSVSTSSQRSMSTVKVDESATYSSLSTILALAKEVIPEYSIIKKNLPIIVDENLTEQPKINAIKQCVTIMNKVINENSPPEILMLFQDAYLNCFHSLHFFSKKLGDSEERKEIWSLIQVSMTELLRIASTRFTSYNADRVDMVGDIAFLCNLFSDVCDSATMTLCMIEAARSRVTQEQAENQAEKERMEIQLKLIDEHLLECRRVQKLRELRSNTKTKNVGRCSRLKRWFKSTLSSRSVPAK
uniref:RING-type domain-containing protein n=1 Tax=Panagrolaimus sp. PS1159 TaxID=55785 RepID=A0AC35G178_9BILA